MHSTGRGLNQIFVEMVMNIDKMVVNRQLKIHRINWVSFFISILCILLLIVSFVVAPPISLRGDLKKGNYTIRYNIYELNSIWKLSRVDPRYKLLPSSTVQCIRQLKIQIKNSWEVIDLNICTLHSIVDEWTFSFLYYGLPQNYCLSIWFARFLVLLYLLGIWG